MKKQNFSNEKLILTVLLCLISTENRASDSINSVESISCLQPQTLSLEDKLNDYMKSPFILSINQKNIVESIKAGLQDYIDETGQWPDDLKVKEKIFCNFCWEPDLVASMISNASIRYTENKNLAQYLFSHTKKIQWNDFQTVSRKRIQDLFYLDLFLLCRNDEKEEFHTFYENYFAQNKIFPRYNVVNFTTNIYRSFSEKEDLSNFIKFCEPYFFDNEDIIKGRELHHHYMLYRGVPNYSMIMDYLLPIYKAYPLAGDRVEFIKFCDDYLQGIKLSQRSYKMNFLLPIYQAFSTKEDLSQFMIFCESYFSDVLDVSEKTRAMHFFVPIYKAYPEQESLFDFIKFCTPYLASVNDASNKSEAMDKLLPIYQGFSTEKDLSDFIKDCELCFSKNGSSWDKAIIMNIFFRMYQLLKSKEKWYSFIKFCKPFFSKGTEHKEMLELLCQTFQEMPKKKERTKLAAFCKRYTRLDIQLNNFFPIFKKLITNPIYNLKFKNFMRIHKNYNFDRGYIVLSFAYRDYLRYFRSFGALEAEINPEKNRVREVYRDGFIYSQLPALHSEDPFLKLVRKSQMHANAHDFDSAYYHDFNVLKAQTEDYNDIIKSTAYTRYNNNEVIPDFHTNAEVDDFILFLDTDFLKKSQNIKIDGKNYDTKQIISLIKQILGIEQKSMDVINHFSPYLGSSMFYAKPDYPKGDEVLGRIWFLVKKLGQEEIIKAKATGEDEKNEAALLHAEALKRSIVFALLESTDMSETKSHTHCQTRITGELLKAICLHLKDSKLRGLIISESIPANDGSEAEINARIKAAPSKAELLFQTIHQSDSANIRTFWETHIQNETKPELFEIYLAYYDALYQRTVISDIDGNREYQKDEHILMRDDHGNLVSLYDADGSMRETPQIVYYQSEFQVIEHTFSHLMKKEFEEQRGAKY